MSEMAPGGANPPGTFWNRYRKYRSSGVSWLAEIPQHWALERLRFAVWLNPTAAEVRSLSPKTDVSFVPMEAVGEFGGLDLSRTMPLDSVSAGYTYFRDGDVLVAKITPCFENGKGADAEGLEAGIGFGTTELHVLRPRQTMDGRYLFYVTLSHAFRKLGEAEMYGAGGQKRVPPAFIENLKHPIPPPPEQHAIAAFLDHETARIDDLVAKNERLIELLEEKRTALITHAVTKGLDPSVPMKETGLEWLGSCPANWSLSSLKRRAHIRYGLGEPPRMLGGGVPFVRATNISGGKVVENEMQFVDPEDVPWRRSPALRTDDIIVVRSGAYTGDSAIIPQEYDGAVAGYDLVVRARDCDPRFLAWVLLSRYACDAQMVLQSTRAAQPHLNAEELGSISILMPPIDAQRDIVWYLEGKTRAIDGLIGNISAAIERLKELRIALISAAVTGRIDVRARSQFDS